jgi:hypothetical protein
MRFLVIGLAAACLALPFGTASRACEGYAAADVLAAIDDGQAAFAQATATDAAKKPAKKKVAAKKKPKEKVEYMRAAPM